ncbi:MAG: 3-methyl-2-oxobutanoate hydroxymethyltransferase [Proteobacteria bacterium]|nr:3-methyl-2-oxobutanoate hydroxymethyltransferase [Pseudomonadota bacterium]MBU1639971.1 3-methyl-2-oxobutanoate hydroxymethyltransferase [Pseudomonadota bacterium]
MKLSAPDIIAKKGVGKITMLTAYDASFARMLESAGVDMLLVGDSLGMVVLGYESTVPVTMDEMIHHAAAVRRGAPGTMLVGDMPFLSYQVSKKEAVANAGRFFKEAACDAVKLEGGHEVCKAVRAIIDAGMPVMGHIGLTPQTAGKLGGFKVQGKDVESARRLLEEAKALEGAGVFSLVLECIPDGLANIISEAISIPTIGIGAGAGCDGQVLVTHDLLGLFEKFVPSFVKNYINLAPEIKKAVASFMAEVKDGSFPDKDHSFPLQIDPSDIFKCADDKTKCTK